MSRSCQYLALKHKFPTELPPELRERQDHLLFARWLVLTGQLSDFVPTARRTGREDEDSVAAAVSRKPRRTRTANRQEVPLASR